MHDITKKPLKSLPLSISFLFALNFWIFPITKNKVATKPNTTDAIHSEMP